MIYTIIASTPCRTTMVLQSLAGLEYLVIKLWKNNRATSTRVWQKNPVLTKQNSIEITSRSDKWHQKSTNKLGWAEPHSRFPPRISSRISLNDSLGGLESFGWDELLKKWHFCLSPLILLFMGWAWNTVWDGQPSPSVTPLPFDWVPIDQPLW